jgi:outer membrane murein-binding lipoprotein Lpp
MPWLKDRQSGTGSGAEPLFGQLFARFFEVNKQHPEDQKTLSLDLDSMSNAPFDTVCCDLLMYESPALFKAAFSLLLREYSSRSALRNQLVQTNLLVSPFFTAWASEMKGRVGHLRHLVSSFSQWGMGDFPQLQVAAQIAERDSKAAEVCYMLASLTSLCTAADTNDAAGQSLNKFNKMCGTFKDTPSFVKFQNLCGTHKVDETVLRLLREPHRLARHLQQDTVGKCRHRRITEHNQLLERLHVHCFAFLAAFVDRSKKRQLAVTANLSTFMDWLGSGAKGQAYSSAQLLPALCAMFCDNRELCEGVPLRLIEMVALRLQEFLSPHGAHGGDELGGRAVVGTRADSLVQFFEHVCIVRATTPADVTEKLHERVCAIPLQQNQQLVLNELAKPCLCNELLCMAEEVELSRLVAANATFRAQEAAQAPVDTSPNDSSLAMAFEACWPSLSAPSGSECASGSEQCTSGRVTVDSMVAQDIKRLYFHTRLQQLLCVVNVGASVAVQARSHVLLPLSTLIASLVRGTVPAQTTSLTRLLTTMYLHSSFGRQHLKPTEFKSLLVALGTKVAEATKAQTVRSDKGSALDFRVSIVYGIAPLVHTFFTATLHADRAVKFDAVKHELVESLLHFQQSAASLSAVESALMRRDIEEVQSTGGVAQLRRISRAAPVLPPPAASVRAEGLPALPKFAPPGLTSAATLAAMTKRPQPPTPQENLKREKHAQFVGLIAGSLPVQAGVEQEFDRLVAIVRSVEALTDPHDVKYAACELDEPRVRTNAVTLTDLATRMVRHVRGPGNLDGTEHDELISCALFAIFQKLVEGEHGFAEGAQTLLGGASEETTDISALCSALCKVYSGACKAVFVWQQASLDRAPSASLCCTLSEWWTMHRPPPASVLRKRCLGFLNSTPCLLFLIALVMVGVLLGELSQSSASTIAQYAFLGIFLTDSALRFASMGPRWFFADPICILELLCCLVDVTLSSGLLDGFIGESSGEQSAVRAGRGVRGVRGVRVLRIVRLIRVLRIVHGSLRLARVFSRVAAWVQGTIKRQNSDSAAARGLVAMQGVLNGAGVLELCLKTMAKETASPALFAAAAQVAIRLVENQNRDAQRIVLQFLGTEDGNGLLRRFEGILDATASAGASEETTGISDAHRRSKRAERTKCAATQRIFLGLLAPAAGMHAGADAAVRAKAERYASCILVVRFLQQCCEGHLADMQAMMLAQPMHLKPVNLLHSATALVQAVARGEQHMMQRVCIEEVQVLVHALDFIIDTVQSTHLSERGNKNQAFVCESGLLTTISQLLSVHMHASGEVLVKDFGGVAMLKMPPAQAVVSLNWSVSVKQLKGRCATLLHALVEGCSGQAQFELLASEVSPTVLNARRKQLFLMVEYLRATEQQAKDDERPDTERVRAGLSAAAHPMIAEGLGLEGQQAKVAQAPAMAASELASLRRLILWVKPDAGSGEVGEGAEAEEDLLQCGLAPGDSSNWEAQFLSEGDMLLMFSETLAQRCPGYATAQISTSDAQVASADAAGSGVEDAARHRFSKATSAYRRVMLAWNRLDEATGPVMSQELPACESASSPAAGAFASVKAGFDAGQYSGSDDEEGPVSRAFVTMRSQRSQNRKKAHFSDTALVELLAVGTSFLRLVNSPVWRHYKAVANDASHRLNHGLRIVHAEKDISSMIETCKSGYNQLLSVRSYLFFRERRYKASALNANCNPNHSSPFLPRAQPLRRDFLGWYTNQGAF